MTHYIRHCLLAMALFLLGATAVLGQKFTTHAVKAGETLESISKRYGVGKEQILKYNKEIKAGDTLRANTILVIPEATPSASEAEERADVSALLKQINKDSVDKREPYTFTTHKVKKRETVYGITKRYNISEEELKRYNKALYASRLKKNMELRIPKYKTAKTEGNSGQVEPMDFEKYVVSPKETRWSIAHKYGITLDSMLALNPSLSKTTNYLAAGDELLLPKRPGSSIPDQKTQLYTSYTVPAKMNFYRLEKEFGVSADEVIRLNPEITERGGLKEGMVIRIPEKTTDLGAVNTENYIFYEVKPKQTEFGLTRKFGLSWPELVALNPELKGGLKAGMVLKLPKDQMGDFEVRNALVLDKFNLLDSIDVAHRPKLLYLLPFRLDKLPMGDDESVEDAINKRTSLKLSLGMYSGALVALDSIKDLGVSVAVKTLDNQLDTLKTMDILVQEDLSMYSAIIGPLDSNSFKHVAQRASRFNVPVVAPVTVKNLGNANNVFYSYTDDEELRSHLLNYVEKKRETEHILVIADNKHKAVADSIVKRFPQASVIPVKQEKKNIGINRDKLAALLSTEEENWVFLETDNVQLISSVVSILNAYNATTLDAFDETKEPIEEQVITDKEKEIISIKLFTTDHNSAFDNDVLSGTHLSNLNFTFPSVYREVPMNAFAKRYRKRFGDYPDRYAVRGFDLTMDVLLKLAFKNNLLEASGLVGSTEYNGSKFDYHKKERSGYYNKASYIMAYEDMRIKQLEE